MKWNVEDVNSDEMIDRPVYSDRLRVTGATERFVKDAVVWRDSMSQSLPTLLLHTQNCVFFFTKKYILYGRGISRHIGTQQKCNMFMLILKQHSNQPIRIQG